MVPGGPGRKRAEPDQDRAQRPGHGGSDHRRREGEKKGISQSQAAKRAEELRLTTGRTNERAACGGSCAVFTNDNNNKNSVVSGLVEAQADTEKKGGSGDPELDQGHGLDPD